MPSAFKQCTVLLDGSKVVYHAGEKVQGKVVLDVTEKITVVAVRVYCYGQALVKWTSNNPLTPVWMNETIAIEKYVGLVITLFGKKPNAAGPNVELTPGRRAHRFSFQLPSDVMPSSYEGHYGAIRYWIQVEVQIPWPSLNKTWIRCFTFLTTLDVNEPRFRVPVTLQSQKTVGRTLGLGQAGHLTLHASLQRSAFCPGELILLSAVVKNDSDKRLGRLVAILCQKVVFSSGNNSQTRNSRLRTICGDPVQAGETRVWTEERLPVEAVPPSTMPRSCHIIKVSYCVKVYVELPFQFDLSVELPVTIGTVPLGHKTRDPNSASAGSIPVLDASGQVTYTMCSKGVEQCSRWEGVFPNFSYTPMTAFVPNTASPPPTAAPHPTLSASPAESAKTHPGSSAGVPATTAATSLGACASVPQNEKLQEVVGNSFGVTSPLEAPPSYEEVVQGLVGGLQAGETLQQAVNETSSCPFLLALRFPDARLAGFRVAMETNRLQLSESGGQVVALSPQPFATKEAWPPRTAIALLRFSSEDRARTWFTSASTDSHASWFSSCDAFLMKMLSDFNKSRKIFTLSFSTVKKNLTGKEVYAALKGVTGPLRQLRASLNGETLTSGRGHSMLRGTWLQGTVAVGLSQWQTIYEYGHYTFSLKEGDMAPLYAKMMGVLDNVEGVIFQTEDLSDFQPRDDETQAAEWREAEAAPGFTNDLMPSGQEVSRKVASADDATNVTSADDTDDVTPGRQDRDDVTSADDADDVTPGNESSSDGLCVEDADVIAQSAATQEISGDGTPHDDVVA